MRHRRSRLGKGLAEARARRRRRPASASPSSAPGPAGLACAQQLARVGHEVHVYEKNAQPGGLLRYGIPDFKMEKRHVERRVAQMRAEGVTFHCNVTVGKDVSAASLVEQYDAVALAGGAEAPRDLPAPGRELAGVHFAMDFLRQQNRRVGGEPIGSNEPIHAAGKHVVVIGGGDTGSDCIGTSIRQGALKVTQLEILPMPPEGGRQDAELAELAAEAEDFVEPRGRRRARFRRRTDASSSARTAQSAASSACASTTR